MPPGPVLTLADGIAVKHPGEITEPLVRKWVDEIVEVDEDSVADAMMLLMERAKLYVEGAGAVGVSALLTALVTPAKTGTTCVVLSGGNVDLGLIPNLVRRHETIAGRRMTTIVTLPDRPGALTQLLSIIADTDANLIEVQHIRDGTELHPQETGAKIVLEVSSLAHAEQVTSLLTKSNYIHTNSGTT